MPLQFYLDSVLLIASSFVFAANNIGMIKTSFQFTAGRAQYIYLLVSIAGMVAGFIFEGYKVSSIASKDIAMLSSSESEIALLTTFAVMAIFTMLKLPASLSNVVLGSLIGVAIASNTAFYSGKVAEVIIAWLIAPLTSGLLAILFYSIYRRLVKDMPLTKISIFNRYSVVAIVLISSYTLSANNLGLLLGFPGGNLLIILLPTIAGVLLLSNIVVSTLGWKMAMLSPTGYMAALLSGSLTLWLYTQLSIPASLTQSVVSGMVALSIYLKPSVVNYRTMFELIGSWPFFLLLSFAISYILTAL